MAVPFVHVVLVLPGQILSLFPHKKNEWSAMSILIGFLAGFFGGLVGVGGAVIMIPFMVGIMKIGQHKAHGTSLVALVFTGVSGAITYALKGSVDIMASLLMAVTAVFAAR